MAYLLQQLLTDAAAQQPQRPAVMADDCLLTYQDLDQMSNRVARTLLRLGVAPGDRVGILIPKSAAAVVAVYGALKSGACYIPLDSKAPIDRLSHIVRDSGAAVIVTDKMRVSQAAALAETTSHPTVLVVVSAASRSEGEKEDAVDLAQDAVIVPWTAVAEESGSPLMEERAIESDLAYILYTSGSTGTPKGVMISHRNSLTFVDWAAAAAGLDEQDHVLQSCAVALRPVGLRSLCYLQDCRMHDGSSRGSGHLSRVDRDMAGSQTDLSMVFSTLGTHATRLLRESAAIRSVRSANDYICRRSLPSQAPYSLDDRTATSPIPELVRPDRDQCLHSVRSACRQD